MYLLHLKDIYLVDLLYPFSKSVNEKGIDVLRRTKMIK